MAFCKHRVMDKCKKDNMPCIYSKECCEPEVKKTTNADRIRNMTDEELADFVTNIHQKDIDEYEYVYIVECTRLEDYEDILEWLQAEVKEGAECWRTIVRE